MQIERIKPIINIQIILKVLQDLGKMFSLGYANYSQKYLFALRELKSSFYCSSFLFQLLIIIGIIKDVPNFTEKNS